MVEASIEGQMSGSSEPRCREPLKVGKGQKIPQEVAKEAIKAELPEQQPEELQTQ